MGRISLRKLVSRRGMALTSFGLRENLWERRRWWKALESFLRNEAFSALLPMQDLVRISKIILPVFQRLSS